MPKSTRHGGTSNAAVAEVTEAPEAVPEQPAAEPEASQTATGDSEQSSDEGATDTAPEGAAEGDDGSQVEEGGEAAEAASPRTSRRKRA